ncbi:MULTISPECIES: PadR family transcriptional regulator [unclassified Gordonia (in: high G+C Gram-positive bacteria)]|uniref:PadR family transcriptional regulator n=1 Tax=unclassified Gordonia (in: high G+C Gram-positive bacteria) TaxID=2657482 RepID=UPI001F0F22DF|nr:PadR family transcriptional regulator [Gordonia sp. ABSL49_1]MCH5644376.1 PadR family transcriptional regulator [Gordonia sp. ABSL49_1]
MGEHGSAQPLPPIAMLILGLLAERPMHPYEMFQTTVERREDRLAKIRPGTMYHSVDRLNSKGLIEIQEVRREGNRPERTVYAITEHGREVLTRSLEQILARHPEEYPELYLALSEAHGLPRARVIELVGERIERMQTELAEYEAAVAVAQACGKPEMFHLDAGCKMATLRTQIDWLTDLVDRMRTSRIAWLDDPDFLTTINGLPAGAAADPERAQKENTP